MQVAGQVKMQHNVASLGIPLASIFASIYRVICMSMIFSCVSLRSSEL